MTAPRAQSESPSASSRILGPYQEGARWRVLLIVDGKRTARTATTRDKALQIAQSLLQRPVAILPRTLGTALREYEAHLRFVRHLAPASCDHAQRTLHAFLGKGDTPLATLTVEKARELARFQHVHSERIRRRYAVSTRYAVLGHAVRFFDWAKSLRYVASNPFAGVRPIGLVGPGPAPLGLDHARTLAAVVLQRATKDPGALGALLVLVMGLRSGQVLPLRVEDVDLPNKVLHIAGPGGKPALRAIPDLLLPCLRAAMTTKSPDALLLGAGRTGQVRPRNFLWRAVQRLCSHAHVTSTSPRSLRMLHAKLAKTATRATARMQVSPSVSPPSTAAPRLPSSSSLAAVRVVDLLGLSLTTILPRLDALLSMFSPEQLDQLRPLFDAG